MVLLLQKKKKYRNYPNLNAIIVVNKEDVYDKDFIICPTYEEDKIKIINIFYGKLHGAWTFKYDYEHNEQIKEGLGATKEKAIHYKYS